MTFSINSLYHYQPKENTMKSTVTLCLLLALSSSSAAFASSDGMPMDMKNMTSPKTKAESGIHKTSAVVKVVDVANGRVTLAHGAIASLNWPPMTMAFTVKDKRLFDKLVVGKTVNVELVREGQGFVVTAVK
jgi:Cu(I)/Ag(I) efflux system protein CusF